MKAGLITLAAALSLASFQLHAADLRFGKPESVAPLAAEEPGGSVLHHHPSSRPGGLEAPSLLAYEASWKAEEGLDEDARTGRAGVYRASASEVAGRGAAATRNRKDEDPAHNASAASKPSHPEPGSWAMILAGLLGVVAIARRRMSA